MSERLRNAGGLDQQINEPAFFRKLAHLQQQVIPQGAADAAVRHFHQRFFRLAELGTTGPHQIRVDIHFRHVIHDHGDAAALAIVEDAVQQRGFAGTEKSGKHRHGEAIVGHGKSPIRNVII